MTRAPAPLSIPKSVLEPAPRPLQRARVLWLLALPVALSTLATRSFAHTPSAQAPHGKKAAAAEQKPWGIAGFTPRVTRTVEFGMGDDMRFTPAALTVNRGETLRLVAHNHGKQMHEFVIGTTDENRVHAEMMKKHPGMEHDEPWMTHVEPGQRGEIVWTFNRAGRFEFACLIAGHYDAGMHGTIEVRA